MHPYYLLRAFQQYQNHGIGALWFGKSQHDKHNKQTIFLRINRHLGDLCHWPNFVHDYVTVPSVNMALMIEPICKGGNFLIKLNSFLMMKITQNSISSPF
jgi:hypothetical protein